MSKVKIDTFWCDGCGTCQDICPTDAIQLAFIDNVFNDAMVFDDCTCCGLCVDWCLSRAITECSNNDDIGGGSVGSGDSGGSGGSGGMTYSPTKYNPESSDVFCKLNLKNSMPKQLPNTCVTSSMEYINNEFCNGSTTEGDYILDYYKTYGVNVVRDGVGLNTIKPFLSRHFKVKTYNGFSNAVDKGWCIMTDMKSNIPDSSHNVLVIGYKTDGKLIYMNPETGYLMEAHVSYFKQHYAIPISSCF